MKRVFSLFLLVVLLSVGPVMAAVNNRGFTGLQGTTTGLMMRKGQASFGLFTSTHTRRYQRFNFNVLEGTRFAIEEDELGVPTGDLNATNVATPWVDNAEVTTLDFTFAGNFAFNDRIEMGVYITHQELDITYDRINSRYRQDGEFGSIGSELIFYDREFVEVDESAGGLTYAGLGLNYRLLSPNSPLTIQGFGASTYFMVHMPLGDETDGLSLGEVELEFGASFSKRFGNFGAHLDGSFQFTGKDTDFPVDGEAFGHGQGTLLMEYLATKWLQFSTSYHIRENINRSDRFAISNLNVATFGARFILRRDAQIVLEDDGEEEGTEDEDVEVEEVRGSDYFFAIEVGVRYAFDDASDDEPLGLFLNLTYAPKGPAGSMSTLTAQLRHHQEEPADPTVVLIADAVAEDAVELFAVTDGVTPSSSTFTWTYADGETITSTGQSIVVSRQEIDRGIVCTVADEHGNVAEDMLFRL